MSVRFVIWLVFFVSHGYSLGPTGLVGTHGHGSNTTSITRPLWNTPEVEMLTDQNKKYWNSDSRHTSDCSPHKKKKTF